MKVLDEVVSAKEYMEFERNHIEQLEQDIRSLLKQLGIKGYVIGFKFQGIDEKDKFHFTDEGLNTFEKLGILDLMHHRAKR